MPRLKVVLLGEGRVGKTSILFRYIRNEFQEKQTSTLQASYMDKRIKVGSVDAQLSVWDTAGQERFHALGPIYYRDADGALLVYDITDLESFAKVRKWVKELRKIVGNDINIVIAGNKIDLERNRQVDEKEVMEYARSVNATHFYTSAKQNIGLEECFTDLATKMVARKKDKFGAGVAGLGVPKGGKNKLLVVDDAEPKAKGSGGGCC
mmetsp:Transcript_11075/g.22072  ORF Transcript_11075/g.22072 Transcript_11075/m.22072 type:complete len:208 (+) Transcript_11075:60-683(+)|eukprot:CAMPEP_0182453856 /NCGR_PEP_ID=MMETSP1319-20130603/734_1 /TAXON_ID=172717 /ORGANISM="Bolidomonas pacifica, Strain RCC208" /LENGTH=207 /DNA_ID=CAMNT_0024651811 /DNA_START=112 /DNA_END=738 /DNA_ORIENTATION=-